MGRMPTTRLSFISSQDDFLRSTCALLRSLKLVPRLPPGNTLFGRLPPVEPISIQTLYLQYKVDNSATSTRLTTIFFSRSRNTALNVRASRNNKGESMSTPISKTVSRWISRRQRKQDQQKRRRFQRRRSLLERLEARVVLNGQPIAIADPFYDQNPPYQHQRRYRLRVRQPGPFNQSDRR